MPPSAPTYAIGSWMCGDAGFNVLDAQGTAWGVHTNGTSGIWDSPGVVLQQTQFPNADGAFRSKNNRTPRAMSITGWGAATSIAGACASRRQLTGLLTGGKQSPLVVTDIDGLVLTASVELADVIKVTPGSLTWDFQLLMSAADPYFYGPAAVFTVGLSTTSGGLDWSTGGGLDWSTGGGLNWGTPGANGLIQVTNPGVHRSWPVFTVAGPTTGVLLGFSITNTLTGQTLVYSGNLFTSDVVTIDTNPATRSVLLNGVDYSKNLTTQQFFSVAAGASATIQFQGNDASATSLLTASLAGAY